MSEVRTNSITDAAGTGAPDFPNGVNAATALIAKVDDTERMRIDSSGNVGIGTSSPTAGYRLDVFGQAQIGDGGGNADINFNASNTGRFLVAGTERMRIDSAGTLQFNSGYGSVAPAYGCRAWVNFNGQGTVAIRASGNVSSVTDLGTGSYRVNLATAMPDANYAAVTGGQNDQGNNGYIVLTSGGMTASTVQVMSRREAGFGDGSLICVSIFR